MPKVDPDSGEMLTDDPDGPEDQAGGRMDDPHDGPDPHEQFGGGQSGG
ncbi:MAG TPA: hypothetical protein VFO65_06695 [Acidimicrobiales bacterium]|nr:hypothetical protein [Acidimicrobiales bacterium]